MKLYLRNVKRVKLHTSPTAISNHKSNPNSNNIELEVNVKLTIKIKQLKQLMYFYASCSCGLWGRKDSYTQGWTSLWEKQLGDTGSMAICLDLIYENTNNHFLFLSSFENQGTWTWTRRNNYLILFNNKKFKSVENQGS